MATPVRPNPAMLPPVQAQPAASPARLAAQRAFFQNAVAAAGGPAPSAPVAPAPVAAPQMHIAAPTGEPPARVLRPGSLLDIKV